jgi:hypothetical protein
MVTCHNKAGSQHALTNPHQVVATSTTRTTQKNKPKNTLQPKKQTPKEVVHSKPPTTTNKQKKTQH